MKLPIKKKYFDLIKSGIKFWEYRDAHITFVCEETKEILRKEVIAVALSKGIKKEYPDVLEDDYTIGFMLK